MSCIESITHQMTLAQWHWDQAHSGASCTWGHYAVALIESLPVIGTLVALIDRIIQCVIGSFFTQPQENPPPPPSPKPLSQPTPTIHIKPEPVPTQQIPRAAPYVPPPRMPTSTRSLFEPVNVSKEDFIGHLRRAKATWPDFIKYLGDAISGGDGPIEDSFDATAGLGLAPVFTGQTYRRRNLDEPRPAPRKPAPVIPASVPAPTATAITLEIEPPKPDPLAKAFRAFDEAFAQRLSRKNEIMDTHLLPEGIVNIVESFLINLQPTPIPALPQMDVDDLSVQKMGRYDSHVPGLTNVEIGFQISESEARKRVPGPAPDCFFVLDRSGTMKHNHGVTTLRAALPQAINRLPADSRVGISTFDHREETPFDLELLDTAARKARCEALQDTSDASIIHPRDYTEMLPNIRTALFRLIEAGAVNQAANIVRLLQIIICTDGGNNTPIPERLISAMLNEIRKVAPELADLVRIHPIGMGNDIRYDQLRALSRGTAEVATVPIDQPQQLRSVIDRILLERGVILNQTFITLEAPAGCTISKVVGYAIPEGVSRLRLPVACLEDGDQIRLFVQLKGPVGGKQMIAKLEGFDQIAREHAEFELTLNLSDGVVERSVTSMIEQFDLYLRTLNRLPQCKTETEQARLIQETLAELDHYFAPWIIALMQISSELTNVYNYDVLAALVGKKLPTLSRDMIKTMIERELQPQLENGFRISPQVQHMIDQELATIRHASHLKRSGPCIATNLIIDDLEQRRLFRRATRDQVAQIFQVEPHIRFFFRRSSYDDHHLVLCWPNPQDPNVPFEQLFNIDQPDKSKPPRLILDNEKTKIKEERVYSSIDNLIQNIETLMKESV